MGKVFGEVGGALGPDGIEAAQQSGRKAPPTFLATTSGQFLTGVSRFDKLTAGAPGYNRSKRPMPIGECVMAIGRRAVAAFAQNW